MKDFDLLIVGSGISGCVTAKTAVSKGLEVCLIDCKSKTRIGDKICGDAIAKHHFDHLKIDYPSGRELESHIKGVKVHSPDLRSVFKIVGKGFSGFIINRHFFGQRLLREALDSGLTFYDDMIAIKPILSEGFVKGVKLKNLKNGATEEIHAKIIIDASGISAVLKRSLPSTFGIEKTLERQDLMSCHREIRNNVSFKSEYCEIFLNFEIAPGGYYWIFPKGEGKVNVGLGVQAKEEYPNPKAQFYKYVLSREMFDKSSLINSGGGFVPTCRPMDSFVSNGIMFVGDAACLVNPIHGGGIGPSMLSGKLAGEIAADALSKGSLSTKGLWEYNIKYMRQYGTKQAGLNIFRLFLQSIKNDDLNYGMRHQIIKPEDVLAVNLEGELRLSAIQKIERAFKGLRKIEMLMGLRRTASKMRRIKELYRNYPEKERFAEWKNEISRLGNS